jgi:hypothetical protein
MPPRRRALIGRRLADLDAAAALESFLALASVHETQWVRVRVPSDRSEEEDGLTIRDGLSALVARAHVLGLPSPGTFTTKPLG